MPLEGFKPTFPASEQPQTHALDHTTAGNLEILRFEFLLSNVLLISMKWLFDMLLLFVSFL